jgi:hypothetical protein
MSEREFNKKVGALQNILIPAAEKAAGHPLLATERMTITKLIRESLADPDPRKVAELQRFVTPKTPAVHSAFTEGGVLDQARRVIAEADVAGAGATKPTNPLVEERVQAELLQRSLSARGMLGRGLTLEEEADLAEAIRDKFGAVFAQEADVSRPNFFGEAVLAGRFGPNNSPGLAPPQVRTAAQISEDVAVLPGQSAAALKAEMNRVARLTTVEGTEAFADHMLAFARTVPFGAARLDQS